jgi:hypothetical protein
MFVVLEYCIQCKMLSIKLTFHPLYEYDPLSLSIRMIFSAVARFLLAYKNGIPPLLILKFLPLCTRNTGKPLLKYKPRLHHLIESDNIFSLSTVPFPKTTRHDHPSTIPTSTCQHLIFCQWHINHMRCVSLSNILEQFLLGKNSPYSPVALMSSMILSFNLMVLVFTVFFIQNHVRTPFFTDTHPNKVI